MNIKNLQKVSALQFQLKAATDKYNALLSLTEKNGGRFGMCDRAYITLGGDTYGNGKMHQFDIKIINSREMVSVCRKLQSDAWGAVASIKAELRGLGVYFGSEG